MKDGAVVLISGRGSNLQALLDNAITRGKVRAAISDNPAASGLDIARERGIPTVVVAPANYPDRAAFESDLAAAIDRFSPRVVALAGFMRILSAAFVRRYRGRLVNIHPSLLPDFAGLDTHRRALAAGVKRTAAPCIMFGGSRSREIIEQAQETILPDDDERTLAARVLAREHRLYPRVVADLLARGALDRWRCARSRGGLSFCGGVVARCARRRFAANRFVSVRRAVGRAL